MTATLRAATLTHFEQVASDCGLDARELVREVGLPLACLHEPDLTIAAHQAAALLELAAERGKEPAFGLRMVASRRLSNLGPLGLLLRDQPTLRQAMEKLVAHIHLHNEAVSLSLEQSGDWVSIREETMLERGLPVRQAVEMAMGTTFRLLRIFLGDGWQPQHVAFRHAAPRHTVWHARVFGGTVLFGQAHNDILCSARDLEASNPGADPVMARYSQRLLGREADADAQMSDRVRRLIVVTLPRGHCRVEVVAQHLGVDRRTVANRLANEGTTFSALVDGMRCELLTQYLEDGARSLSEVALLLGFSEVSAFSRWHRHRFGISARQRRSGPASK